ncbi:hypothetical protein S40293_11455 [Stachybotrys chartarum IBT 40293]|nr:hypothetical protein S40293_11455 [Stachybotrys chartarum IBT 40293]
MARKTTPKTATTKFKGYKSTKSLSAFSDFITEHCLITRFVRPFKGHFFAEEVRTSFLDLGSGCFALKSSSIVYPCCCKAGTSSDAREIIFTSGDWIKGSRSSEIRQLNQSESQACESKAHEALRLFTDLIDGSNQQTVQVTAVSPAVWDNSRRQKAPKQSNDQEGKTKNDIANHYLELLRDGLKAAIELNSILWDGIVNSLITLGNRKSIRNLNEELQSLSEELWSLSERTEEASNILVYTLQLLASNDSLYDWRINGRTQYEYKSSQYRGMQLAEFANKLVNALVPKVGRKALLVYTALAGNVNGRSRLDVADLSSYKFQTFCCDQRV